MKEEYKGMSKKIIQSIMLILLMLSVAIVGIYPFSNQNITLEIETKDSTQNIVLQKDTINNVDNIELNIDGVDKWEIREIRFHRLFKSISVDKISGANLSNYAQLLDNKIIFNEYGSKKINDASKTILMERIMLAEILFLIYLLLRILLNAIYEKKTDDYGNHGPLFELKRFFADIVKYREYIFYSAKADLNAEVANSYLNRLWWLLEPLFDMLVYVIVFANVLGNSVENYATYIFSALLMWGFFSKTINYSVKCVRNNAGIVTKIYVPKYVLLLSNMVLNFLKLSFSMIVLVIMMIIFRINIGVGTLWVFPAYIVMMILAFSVGMIFMHFGVFVDDLGYAVGILLQMLNFLSGTFYDVIQTLHAPLGSIMMCLNPCAMLIDTMRNALLYNVVSNVPQLVIWFMISLLLGYVGLHTVYKNENSYVKVI